MPLKIVRNDITKMDTEAIVNTANTEPVVGTGCDHDVYKAAGYDDLLRYRKEYIGHVPEGRAFLTPGFKLPAKYIIHTVSPAYRNDLGKQEKKIRMCYRQSLQMAKAHQIRSIAFPVIATGGFGFPKEEGVRIAVDEINSFLSGNDMMIYLVVFGRKTTDIGKTIYPDLEAYIDQNYVEAQYKREYSFRLRATSARPAAYGRTGLMMEEASPSYDFDERHENKLEKRMEHLTDTFSQYLLYMIKAKNMENAEVYKRAIVDKKTFSKIKNHRNYHPQKLTALCLCIGAKLNLDESKDLLARAGYALSPCDKTDIIFSYFIENEIYDMIELDIQLEEHGLPCIIE